MSMSIHTYRQYDIQPDLMDKYVIRVDIHYTSNLEILRYPWIFLIYLFFGRKNKLFLIIKKLHILNIYT